MKAIISLTIFGLVAVAYAAVIVPIAYPEGHCPKGMEENVTLLPNPKNCSTYYACVLEDPVLMSCPKGLHFNANETVCDWPWRACCDPAYDPQKKCKKSL